MFPPAVTVTAPPAPPPPPAPPRPIEPPSEPAIASPPRPPPPPIDWANTPSDRSPVVVVAEPSSRWKPVTGSTAVFTVTAPPAPPPPALPPNAKPRNDEPA